MILLYDVVIPPSILSLRSFYLWTEYHFFFFLHFFASWNSPEGFCWNVPLNFEQERIHMPVNGIWFLKLNIFHASYGNQAKGKAKHKWDSFIVWIFYRKNHGKNSYHCCVVYLNENCLWRWDSFFMSFFFLLRPSKNYNHFYNPKNYFSSIADFPL